LESKSGITAVINQPDGKLMMPYETAKRQFTVSQGDDVTSPTGLLEALGLPSDERSDPADAIPIALGILQGYRWRSGEAHDPEKRETFLIPALEDPSGYANSMKPMEATPDDTTTMDSPESTEDDESDNTVRPEVNPDELTTPDGTLVS
jgi:hypothetical protein